MKLPSPLISFMIVSVGIHIAFLASSNSMAITLPGSMESVIAVKLEDIKHTTVESIKKPPNKKTAKTSLTKIPTQPKIDQNKSVSKVVKETKKKTNSINTKENQDRVVAVIYEELKPYFKYPKLAVRRNWQGNVLLSLRVSSNGDIKKIQLEKSSGHNILDQAALASLRKIRNLPKISSWLSRDIELKFPVRYQLVEG